MKKKQLLAAAAILLTICVSVGCGGGETKETNKAGETAPSQTSQVGEQQGEAEDAAGAEDLPAEIAPGVRPNGKLPEDLRGGAMSHEEYAYYTGEIFEAYKNLDCDTLAVYASSEEVVEHLRKIKEDPKALEWWNRIIGNIIYFADSDVMIAKQSDYIYAAWYTDCWKNGVEIPESTDMLTMEEAQSIYDTYYESAPYGIGNLRSEIEYYTENGYLKCNLDDILEQTISSASIIFTSPEGPLNAAVLLLGWDSDFGFGYEHIRDDMPYYEMLLSKDMGQLVELTQQVDEKQRKKRYWECFETYYVDEQNREKIQQFIDEKCMVLRDGGAIMYYFPGDWEQFNQVKNQLKWVSDTEKAQMAELNIMHQRRISDYLEEFDRDFGVYVEIAEEAVRQGYLE